MLGFGKSKKAPAAPRKIDVEAGFGMGLLAQLSASPVAHVYDVPTDVVDEEHLLEDIQTVFDEAGVQITTAGSEVNGNCALLPQPDGVHGRHTVAVVVSGRCVGYLPPEIAGVYAPKLSALTAQGYALEGEVRIWSAEKPAGMYARTSLYLPEASTL
jgi:hypothetical protein